MLLQDQRVDDLWACIPRRFLLPGVFIVGVLIGWLAWGQGRTPVLAVLVPVLAVLVPRSAHICLLVSGYTLGASRALLPSAFTFGHDAFEQSLFVFGWSLNALLVGALWAAACHLAGQRRWARAAAVALVQVATLIPPLQLLGMMHPVAASGYLFAGLGTVGLGLTIVVPCCLAAWCASAKARNATPFFVAAVLGIAVLSVRDDPALEFHGSTLAARTRSGSPLQKDYDPAGRLPKIAKAIEVIGSGPGPKVKTVVFPETTLGYAGPATEFLAKLELLPTLQKYGMTAILGGDRDVDGLMRVSAVVVRPSGEITRVDARQPMPFALWRPWTSSGYSADLNRKSLVTLPDGKRAWLSFCFEDVLPGLAISAMREHKPDYMLSLANNWWAPGDEASEVQARSIESMARLYGVEPLRSVNRARKPGSS